MFDFAKFEDLWQALWAYIYDVLRYFGYDFFEEK